MKIWRVFVFIFLCILCFVLGTKINAQASPFPNPPVPCDSLDDPEFHSLRPHQASANCQVELTPLAKFCGNELTFQDAITENYPGGGTCSTNGGVVTCNYNEHIERHLVINLDGANLPIMGNTEEVTNHLGEPDQLTEPQKVNNYVSWYLNGVNNRAEYAPLDVSKNCIGETTQIAGVCLDTDASGTCIQPILLPALSSIPNPILTPDGVAPCGGAKSCCVNELVGDTVDILGREKLTNYSGPINKLLPQEVQQQARAQTVKNVAETGDIRHDQIVGCTYGIPIPGLGQIGAFPGPCYFESGILTTITSLLGIKRAYHLSEWSTHLPPIRSEFSDYAQYEMAYRTWRGEACIGIPLPGSIPIIGGKTVVLCGDNPLNPNFWSNLYQNIPLSSTEDLTGGVAIDEESIPTSQTSGEVSLTNIAFNNQIPSTLFFSHMAETNGLANLLQNTFVSSDQTQNKMADPTDVSTTACCSTVEVRSNKGDNLFATPIEGDLVYDAAFSCNFKTRDQQIADGDCTLIPIVNVYICPPQSCTVNISITLTTLSGTPKVDDIWSQTVAGPQSIFKRIFPKTNTEGGVGQIIDMPGSTNITYSGMYIANQSTDLKFPHIGGISEYFLKGIQTILRPKGYGDPITFAPNNPSSGVAAPVCAPYTYPTPTPGTPPPGATPTPGSGDVCAVAGNYNIPCCQLQGIMELETGSGSNMGTSTCGSFSCCNGIGCGPAQISCGQYVGFTGNDNLDMCSMEGSAELLARAMLLKLCQADGVCDSYDWKVWGDYVLQNYSIPDGDYTAAAYFNGLGGGCAISDCSQFRWGAGKGYCDAVEAYCNTGSVLPDATDWSFCEGCNEDLIRSGVAPNTCQ
jgi:hypothetical protein